jgi:hypothetical protein
MERPIRVRTGAGAARAYGAAALAVALGTKIQPKITGLPSKEEQQKVIPARILRRMRHMQDDDLRSMSMAQQKREKRLARNRKIAGHPEPSHEKRPEPAEQVDMFE